MHQESLLRIPLVRQMLTDPHIRLQARAIDQEWYYQGILPTSMSGFNPFAQTVYYGAESITAQWLKNPAGSFRALNSQDRGLHEVLMLVHDYLHAWAYRELQALSGKRAFGAAPVTSANFEDSVFFHILSEAVATVGLDYWFLAEQDLNAVASVGTRLRMLTAQYHRSDLEEFRRFHPKFDPHRREFFEEVAQFYCSGKILGFPQRALHESAIVCHWMSQELTYGELQRAYCRRWMRHLGGHRKKDSLADKRPVRFKQKWQREVTEVLGLRLWRMVRGEEHRTAPTWRSGLSAKARGLDFRFVNLNTVPSDQLTQALLNKLLGDQKQAFLNQELAGVATQGLKRFKPNVRKRLIQLYRTGDAWGLHCAVQELTQVASAASLPEPECLFFLG